MEFAGKAAKRKKTEMYGLVHDLYMHGMTSPTLIGQALYISTPYAIKILTELNLYKPRKSLRDHLAGLPEPLRERLNAFTQ